MANDEKEITLRSLRGRLSQEDLARQLGVDQKTISYWERRLSIPTLDNAIVLAVFFDLSLKDLAKALGLDASRVRDDKSISQAQSTMPAMAPKPDEP